MEPRGERTLCLIKPGAYPSFTVILEELVDAGFSIVGLKMFRWSDVEASIFYLEHKGKDFFPGLVRYMVSGPIVAVVLEAPDAVRRYRNMMGATNPANAAKGTLRKKFGRNIPDNAVHGSDSSESAAREISLLFRPEELL